MEIGDDAIVVRFNGGAQAGHTVVARMAGATYSAMSAAALAGAATYLSRFSSPIPSCS